MRRYELAKHNGQLHLEKVRRRVRRKVLAACANSECVLVDGDGATITAEQLGEILEGLPAEKVRVIRPATLAKMSNHHARDLARNVVGAVQSRKDPFPALSEATKHGLSRGTGTFRRSKRR